MTDEISKDVDLLDKVLLRFGIADDSQLEKQLDGLLIPVLAKLNSTHEPVRKKVLEVLAHVNKRVKPVQTIKLPIQQLVSLYNDPTSSNFLLNFVIIYLDMGWNRAAIEERKALFPVLLAGISKRPAAQQDVLLHMAMSIVDKIPVPKPEEKSLYAFAQDPADVAVILRFLQDILLLYFTNIEETIPAGMSKKGYARMTAKLQSKDALLTLKTTIIDWLWKSGLFAENDIAPLLIIASCDTYHNVVQKAEDALKRIKLNYEDATFVDKLYKIYQGTANPKSTEPAEEQIQPANVILKTKLLNYMSRSIAAANVFPGSIQVIFDAVYGKDTNTRLKTASMIYVQWVFRFASDERLTQMGPIILSGLLKLISELKKADETQGKAFQYCFDIQDSIQLKNYSYSAVGLLAKRVPSLFRKDLTLLTQMFASLREPSEDKVKSTIFETLQMMSPAYHALEEDVSSMVQQFLLETVTKDDPLSRLAALYFANRIFPFRNVPSRIMCLLSLDDIKLEVKEEAQKGLKPYKYKDNEIVVDPTEPYPEFADVIHYVYRLATATYSTTTSPDAEEPEKQPETKTERAKVSPSRFKPAVFEKILGFARTCLEVSATKAETSQQTYLENLLKDSTKSEVVNEYMELIDAGLGPTGNRSYLHHATLTILLEFLSFIPDFVSDYYSKKAESFRHFLFQGSYDSRELAARVFGLFSSKLETSYLTTVLKEAIQFSDQDTVGFDKQLGSVLTTGFVLSRLIQHHVALAGEFTKTAIEKLFNVVNHFQNPVLGSNAVTAIGWIGRYSPLPVADGEASNSATPACTKIGIVEKLGKLVNSSEGKVIERSAQAIANLCLGQLDGPFVDVAYKVLFEAGITHSNNLEVHFTVGEALSCIAAGWTSKAAKDAYADSIVADFDKIKDSMPPAETTKVILDLILSKHLIVDRSRSAACLWLLSLVKLSGNHSYIKAQLPTIQMYFTYLLSDTNEVTQECASKGLVFVYEQGDEALKKQLVKDLTETLSGGKKSGFKLSEETKVVPEGLLKNPEGEGYSTYKELCSLATEMGQPELVYKFINLTAHNQLWSSRKGAAFAVSGILSQATDELSPMYANLIPKLYRYSFDPNPKISASMKSILNSMMEPKKVLSDFFKPIMRELLESLNNNLWRVREGACYAMSDALQGRNFEDISDILEECWFRVMRVIDDIKESVRLAAKVTFKSLSTLTSRLCDPTYTNAEQASKAIVKDIALPFLLQKGLVNESDEVKGLSLDQILKITKVAGKLLGPHIPLVVGVLLEGLSSLEPGVFSYLSFHTEKMNITQEQLDESRMLVAKMSPMHDTLEHCVKYVDENNLAPLVAKLVETINTGVGLPTRAGVAKFISSILLQKAEVLKPHAAKLTLALLSSQGNVKDKSIVLRKANANAIAGLARLVPAATLKKLVDKLIELARDTENTESRISSAVTFLELLKRAPEELKPYLDKIVPVLFMARHDPVEEVAKIYKDAWEEFGLGNSGIRNSLDAVVEEILQSLGSSSWNHKKQAALSLKDIGDSTSLSSYMKPYLEKILATLSEGLAGRIWQGKETLLQAVASLSSGCKNEIWELADKSPAVSPLSIVQLLLKECKRNDKEYKRHAMNALALTIQAFNSETNHIDIFGVVKEVLIPIALGEEQSNTDNQQKDEDPKTKPLLLLMRASAFKSLGEAFPHKSDLQKQYVAEILGVLLKNLPNNVWNIRLEILASLRVVIQRLSVTDLSDNLMKDILSVLLYDSALNDVKYAQIRNSAIDILSDIIIKVDGTELLIPHLQDIQQQIQKCGTIDMNSQVAAEKLRSQITEHLSKKKKT